MFKQKTFRYSLEKNEILKEPSIITFIYESKEHYLTQAGFIMIALRRRSPFLYCGEIIAIAVDPKNQRKGIGRELLQFSWNWINQISPFIFIKGFNLSVAEDNIKAQKFFLKKYTLQV